MSRKWLFLVFFLLAQRNPEKTLLIYKAPHLERFEKGWILHPAYPRKKSVLFLHGWGYNPLHFFNLCPSGNYFLQKGYTVFLPDMGKSVYASRNFSETRFPHRPLMQDLLKFIEKIQKKYKYLIGEPSILFGISTGARGAALLNIQTDDSLFSQILLFSGDYCQELFPEDKLIASVYGKFKKFPERWKKTDNPCFLVRKWETPTFIAHARNDKIVTYKHSEKFYQKIKKSDPNFVSYWFPAKGGHTHNFWEQALRKFLSRKKLQ